MLDVDRENPAIILGFDFGMKHLGVAVGQTLTQTASPLTTLKAQEGLPQWSAIANLLTEWQPQALVVGIPVAMNEAKLTVTPMAQAFVEFLKSHTNLPVYTTDERLTTKEAKRLLFEKRGARGLQKQKIDSLAAKLILENWLQTT